MPRFLTLSWIIASACVATTFKYNVLKIQLCTLEIINNKNNKSPFASAHYIFRIIFEKEHI